MKIATHNLDFHADDVFAVAILKMVYPNAEIIRTRDKSIFAQADFRIDVGRAYNPKTHDFDHHQPEGAGKRENGIPYASAGIVWKEFGIKITNSIRVFEILDKKIFQFLDSHDNGISTFTAKKTVPYTLPMIISSMNPVWPNKTHEKYYLQFIKAVEFAKNIIINEKASIESKIKAEKILEKIVKSSKKEYIILDSYIPYENYLSAKTKVKFAIYFEPLENDWWIGAISKYPGTFKCRAYFPKSWGGLEKAELEEASKISGAIFCHTGLFFARAKTKESAIKMVEIALSKGKK